MPDPLDDALARNSAADEPGFWIEDDAPVVSASPPPVRVPSVIGSRFRGPGFWESLLWMAGCLITQLGAALGMTALLGVIYVVSHASLSPDVNTAAKYIEQNLFSIIAVGQLVTVIYAMGAVAFRLRPHGLQSLGVQLPKFGHCLLVMAAVLPLSLVCSPIQQLMLEWMPDSDMGMRQAIEEMSHAPFPLLVLVIALLPALGEELIFRGLIGRGLTERWGMVAGVAVTSVLFGVGHLNPAQGLAVIPLGVAMHFVYLTTRSIWAPVLLHFLNNGFAAVMLKYGSSASSGGTGGGMLAGDESFPPTLIMASMAVLITLCLLLWLTRVRDPEPAVALPPGEELASASDATILLLLRDRSAQPAPPWSLLIAGGAFNLLGFIAVLWREW